MTVRYPVLLDLAGVECLVVGGGPVAERKVAALVDAGARVHVVAPDATDELERRSCEGAITWSASSYLAWVASGADHRRYRFVVAATDDLSVNQRVVADAEAAGTWANDASVSGGGPAAIPAVHRRGPITLAVSTGGAHPGAAAWLRDDLADRIGAEVVTALRLVDEVRPPNGPDGRPVSRPDWRCAVDSGMLASIRAGHLAEAKERLQACLSSSSD